MGHGASRAPNGHLTGFGKSAEVVPSSTTSMNAIPADVWPYILQELSHCDVINLTACTRACWQVSKRTLKLELCANEQLHNRLVSLLYYLTSRRKRLQVCLQQ